MVAVDAGAAKSAKPKRKVAPDSVEAPSAEAKSPHGKSIFLFADGTGNSSAKLFKTNVWKMYEAIDFGAASQGGHVQVGYYDNGVGTSAFRPLALLGGIFGVGLKSNVLRLYTFLCRNYQPGDRIYAFGFSRGAFTIRLLVSLVADQGILMPPVGKHAGSHQVREASLSRQVHQAYRDFRRTFVPNLPIGWVLVFLVRALRDALLAVGHAIAAAWRNLWNKPQPAPRERCYPDIEFVGVWDTVAAYGGPFAEFTRGIDDWVFPLTMPDHFLSPKVKKARHALSLDDERDAFWPLLWDEVHEHDVINKGWPVTVGRDADGKPIQETRKVAEDRLRQVWFAGVHSDVGGGYPDESLSYIPLLWMMDELGNEVDFLRTFVDRARDLANPYGPIHDSRAGPAAYYRYQPRKIAAFMDPASDSTVSLRQPVWGGSPAWRGLLRSVCVHESVFARVISGIDNYAPAALPARFDIVSATGPRAIPVLTEKNLATLNDASAEADLRFDHQEEAWNGVWWRRLIYFLTIAMTIVLLMAPWTKWLQGIDQLCSDDRCFARSFFEYALFFVPQSIRNSLNPWASVPLDVIVFGLAIFGLIAWGRRTERRFRDRVREIWRDYLGETGAALSPLDRGDRSSLRPVRESLIYQGIIFILKWDLLPAACGIATLVVLLYGGLVVATQVIYARAESKTAFCKIHFQTAAADSVTDVPFSTSDSCTDLGVRLTQGKPYRLTIKAIPADPKQTSPWFDDTIAADPRRGIADRHLGMIPFAPLKRVTSANWMQVMTEVRADQADTWSRQFFSPIFGLGIDMRKQELTFLGNQTYETTFCARWNGRLYLMVNDAAPLLSQRFYKNNRGAALVSVAPAPDKQCAPTQ